MVRPKSVSNATISVRPTIANVIVALYLLQLLFINMCRLRSVDSQRQFAELTGKLNRQLVLIVHPRAGVGTNVEALLELEDERNSAVHRLRGHNLILDLQHVGAATTESAEVV